ncbi:hypothetical protein [Burkholderia multivorans]|uniref:hypothetical protein n=1 Tax=Burkholderia multivorans TaxID=87883 RepID=UPI002018432B|nr:hypothetical protein [Burkholderia multivorans]MCL4651595.1 hypothetical protein [Burkholderia multivorans]MCL4655182.1 hypothetical protein [Burkholderia multivorans]MCO1426100.1 hypothetical protein [Burkholderia multivorans]UQN51239.1 hypothetical protein L0Y88_09240 [Burkholderia multivorans]UQN84412.1 hypothetical protein L0Z18_19365 [Burkholderia multivorans]
MNIEHNPNAAPADERAARLDDADIDTIAESMPGGLDSFIKQWGWRQFARAVEDEVILNVARAASANETGAEGVPLAMALNPNAPPLTMTLGPAQAAEPVAWMVFAANTRQPCEVTLYKSETEALRQDCVVPLYAAPQHPAQTDAREGLTDEQRDVLGGNFGALEQAENLCRATGNDSSAEGLKALSHALHAFLKGADHAE